MRIIWNDELYHYGVPRRSGRYKWGSGKNPFHHGSDLKSTRLGKKIAKNEYAIAKRTSQIKKLDKKINNGLSDKKLAKTVNKRSRLYSKNHEAIIENKAYSEKKKRIEASKKPQEEKKPDIQKVISSGDAKMVLKNKKYLSNQQMTEALKRVNTEQQLKKIAAKDTYKGLKKLESIASVVDRSAKVLKTFNDSAKVFEEVLGSSNKSSQNEQTSSSSGAKSKVKSTIADAVKNNYKKRKEKANQTKWKDVPDMKLSPDILALPAPAKRKRGKRR